MIRINCIVIDDNTVDRLTVSSYISKYPILNLVQSFSNAGDAIDFEGINDVDVVFLDIDMPGISGLEFRKTIDKIPACIFITAYAEYAIDSYEVDTLDFIVKPLRAERFQKAVERLQQFIEIRQNLDIYRNTFEEKYIFIKEGYKETKIYYQDVIYLEGLKDYTLIATSQKKHCVLFSIGNLLKESFFSSFVRVHKSYAVKKEAISSFTYQNVFLHNGITLPIGRIYKSNIIVLK